MKIIFLSHTATTLMMAGIIWFVQVVHYPLFTRVGPTSFASFQADHIRLTTLVVAPIMLIEGMTALLLLWRRPPLLTGQQVWLGFGFLLLIWLSTLLLQIPQHNLLRLGFNSTVHRSLLLSNWIRTFAWTARGLLVLLSAARFFPRNQFRVNRER